MGVPAQGSTGRPAGYRNGHSRWESTAGALLGAQLATERNWELGFPAVGFAGRPTGYNDELEPVMGIPEQGFAERPAGYRNKPAA